MQGHSIELSVQTPEAERSAQERQGESEKRGGGVVGLYNNAHAHSSVGVADKRGSP